MSFIIEAFNKFSLLFNKSSDYMQKQSKMNVLPFELQSKIFSFCTPQELVKLSFISKEWKILVQDPSLWKVFCQQIGLTHISSDPRVDYFFGCAFQRLQFKQNLGEELFIKIQQMSVLKDEIKGLSASFQEHNEYELANLIKWGGKKVKKDLIRKKIIGDQLFLFFIKADNWSTTVYRFNLKFNPNSFEKKQYLYWEYSVGSTSGYYLDKDYKLFPRSIELLEVWGRLQTRFSKLFDPQDK